MAYTSNKTPAELSELSALATNDTIIVGDTSDTAEVVKKITAENLYIDIASSTMTMTNKILTTPTLTLKQSASPTPTAEGDIQWDTDDNKIVVGDGATAKTFVPTSAFSGGATVSTSGVVTLERVFPDTLCFSSITPSGNERILYGDETFMMGSNTTNFYIQTMNYRPQARNTTSDWAAADTVQAGAVMLGDYIYILLKDNGTAPDENRVYRYAKNNIAAGGTQMTFSGAKVLINLDSVPYMTSDGTNFYFMHDAGNSANSYVLAKYSLSGTTFTYIESITCGSTAITSFVVLSNGTILAERASSTLAKYNSSGAEQYVTASGTFVTNGSRMANYADRVYVANTQHVWSRFYAD